MMAELSGTPRLVVSLLYGAGLRLQEALGLRVKDVETPTWRWFADNISPTGAAAWAESRFPTPSIASIQTQASSGRGNSCFRQPASAATRGGAHPAGITCTSRPCSGLFASPVCAESSYAGSTITSTIGSSSPRRVPFRSLRCGMPLAATPRSCNKPPNKRLQPSAAGR